MIREAKRPRPATPAAAYIRMSGQEQQKSPAEQRDEIAKLAVREGCQIAAQHWFKDDAVTGNSNSDERPGLAELLAAAKAGHFKVLLAWHTNRISREDPMDAIVFYNQLRKAGIELHTCCEGAIDLDDFSKQLLLFINQKGSNDFLSELSAKLLRGRLATARAGHWNGGPAPYAMERVEFDSSGRLIRRLPPGGRAAKGNYLRLLPCQDERKLEAVRYAFERYDTSHISKNALARELQTKGFPPPNGTPWTRDQVMRLLRSPTYGGTAQWGVRATGRYHQASGNDIIAGVKSKFRKGKGRLKLVEDTIIVAVRTRPSFPRTCASGSTKRPA